MQLVDDSFQAVWRTHVGDRPVGHQHFWRRALSRRRFIGAAIASGAALSLQGVPAVAEAAKTPVLPNKIFGGTALPGPNGFLTRGFYFPTAANPVGSINIVANGTGDGSTIRDFKGSLAVVEFPPTGAITGADPLGGKFWAADIRFMDGQYIGRDNKKHQGTFGFI
jgi:hypothetical protein